ncbi:hypothetical protein F443_16634, partial [Phytophthora nicotianae P1569]
KVVLYYFLPEHSHNIADRFIAWCRRATRGLNLYTPKDLIKEVNKVKSVQGVFLNHTDADRPFDMGWNELLSKYFIPPPGGYTTNYLFEIDRGVCSARRTGETPGEDSFVFDGSSWKC